MVWGDEFKFTRTGRLLSRIGRGIARKIPRWLKFAKGAIIGFLAGAILAFVLAWTAWFFILHPMQVERELSRIRDTVERTGCIMWVIDGRLINVETSQEQLAMELDIWHAENKSIAETVLRRQGVRFPKTRSVADTVREWERVPHEYAPR